MIKLGAYTMIEIIKSIILGLIQGLTEFLPLSSSAHLNLFPWIFNWNEISESFDVALHLGTLFAICVFFFKDWIELIKGGFLVLKEKFTKGSKEENSEVKNKKSKSKKSGNTKLTDKDILNGKMFWYIIAATIPAGILSLVLDKVSEVIINGNLNLEMALIAVALIVMGIVLYFVDKKSKSEITYENINLKQ